MNLRTCAVFVSIVAAAVDTATPAPSETAITSVVARRYYNVGTSSDTAKGGASTALGPLEQVDSTTDTLGTAGISTSTSIDVTADSIDFSGSGTATLNLLKPAGGEYPPVASTKNHLSFTTTTLTVYTLEGALSSTDLTGHQGFGCALLNGPVFLAGFGTSVSPVRMSGDLAGLLVPGSYTFAVDLQTSSVSAPDTQITGFSNVAFNVSRFAPPTYKGACRNASGTNRKDMEGTADVSIDGSGAVTGALDVGGDKLPFSGILGPDGKLRPQYALAFTLARSGRPDLWLTLTVQGPGASVTGTLVEAGTNATSQLTLTGGGQPALLKGSIFDSTKPGKDTVSLSWKFGKSGKTFDPRPTAAFFEFGDPAAPVHVDIAAADPGWKGGKGSWTWSSAKGASPAFKLKLNGVTGTYSLAASRFDVAAAPAVGFAASVSVGGSSCSQTVTFRARPKGKFSYKR